jgi:uncharacterized protein
LKDTFHQRIIFERQPVDAPPTYLRNVAQTTMEKYYPSHWPENPFHPGEVELQKLAGVHDSVMSYAPRVVRPFMPQQHFDFYQHQPFLVAAARDSHGDMWSTLLTSPTGAADLVQSSHDSDLAKLHIHGGPVRGDALRGEIHPGSDLGLLGIEFATKRRNRVNGRIVSMLKNAAGGDFLSPPVMVFQVDQSFGNCPQYIQPRQWWSVGTPPNSYDHLDGITSTDEGFCRPKQLTPDQMEYVKQAQTLFVATGYRGVGQDVRYGNDASHRGGPPGFVLVKDSRTLILPEFAGNNHFNSLGNLRMDPRMGITFPDFEGGGMLQLSGVAEVETDSEMAASVFPGALRLITFRIEQVNEVVAGSLPVRWSATSQERPLQVKAIVQESEDVKSFYLQPLPQDKRPLWSFQAGQHLPIRMLTDDGTEVWRTYSLSGPPSSTDSGTSNYYRISVKREVMGLASRILHDDTEVGDVVEVSRPAGDFVLTPAMNDTTRSSRDEEKKSDDHRDMHSRTLVLLSSGIGITPLLSMLHVAASNQRSPPFTRVVWIHGARDGSHHPFQSEVQELKKASLLVPIDTHVRYSQPAEADGKNCDSLGRIDASLILEMLRTEVEVWNADYFMCGPSSFLSDMEGYLEQMGVEPGNVRIESF